MASFKLHMLLRLKVPKHNCEVCYKNFKYFSTMVTHKRLHFGERPHKCGERECGLRFVNESALKTHALLHKQEKLLPANDVGNATSSNEPPTSYQPYTGKCFLIADSFKKVMFSHF